MDLGVINPAEKEYQLFKCYCKASLGDTVVFFRETTVVP